MKLILDIKDDKALFIVEMLKNFKYVKTKPLTNYKSEVLEGLKEGIDEMQQIKKGELKGIAAKDLLNEL
jgi:DNA-binding protein